MEIKLPGVDGVLLTRNGQQHENRDYPLMLCQTGNKSNRKFQTYFRLNINCFECYATLSQVITLQYDDF